MGVLDSFPSLWQNIIDNQPKMEERLDLYYGFGSLSPWSVFLLFLVGGKAAHPVKSTWRGKAANLMAARKQKLIETCMPILLSRAHPNNLNSFQ
jgi:hypothetical protein